LKDNLHRYFGHRVELRAFGITYRGLLVGADEDTLYLKAETTWITVPLEEVSSLKPMQSSETDRIYKPVEGEPKELSDEERAEKREAAFKLQVVATEGEDEQGEEEEQS
jgi:hypothetical protein